MRSPRSLAVLSAVCSALSLAACSSDDAYGGGGGDYDYDAAIYEPSCGQACRDFFVGDAVDDTLLLLYNLNLVGMPSGSIDVTAACPLGGSAHITGTLNTTTDNTTTIHLVYALDACKNSSDDYSLTFTGEVKLDGNFNNGETGATKFTTFTQMSDDLEIGGTLKFVYIKEPDVNESCPLAQIKEFHDGDDYATLNGSWCEREFTSGSATASGGEGGSGTSGGGESGTSGGESGTSGGTSGSGSTGEDGLCVFTSRGACFPCTIASADTACDGSENCCELGALGFCTDLTGGACLPCTDNSQCDPGQFCCH